MRRVAGVLVGVLSVAPSCIVPQRLPDCVEAAPPEEGAPRLDPGGDPVLLAAGDIIEDETTIHSDATGRLLDRYDGQVATLGDNCNTHGRLEDYLDAYALSWGRQRWRTRPSVGNHDYMTAHAAAYYAYFCSAAGTPFDGWYSYDLGAWHLIALNSMCAELHAVGEGPRCDAGSAQVRWLEADLAAHPRRCTLAYWHHPRWSDDVEGDKPQLAAVWDVLYRAGVDVVLNGHVHLYQRFAPMAPDGSLDPANGIRQMIVGTGGAPLRPTGHTRPNSELQIDDTFGILRLGLHAGSYDWQFIDVDGRVRDEGSGSCHGG